jgi:predicted ATPase
LAHEFSHSYTLALVRYFAIWQHFFLRDISTIQKEAKELIQLSTEQGFPIWLAFGKLLEGWTLAMEGQGEVGIAQISKAASDILATGMEQKRPFNQAILAEVYGNAGKFEQGFHLLAEAQASVKKTGERLWEAEIHRLEGKLLLAMSAENQSEAEICFQQALDVARHQKAKSLELRAAMSLSRLWQGQGKRTEAQKLLAEIYGWFTEGFDTADLKNAKMLFEELS